MQYTLECECGWRTRGNEDEVVRRAQEHGREVHDIEPSRDQVLSAAKPVQSE